MRYRILDQPGAAGKVTGHVVDNEPLIGIPLAPLPRNGATNAAAMRSEYVRGNHPGWETYVNGPDDHAALLSVPGIGPARAELILRVYGSVDAFLAEHPDNVAPRTRRLIGPRLARKLQAACQEAGIRTDWRKVARINDDLAVPANTLRHRGARATRRVAAQLRAAWLGHNGRSDPT